MIKVLVVYYNILIINQYYPVYRLKILDIMLGKGKGLILGKLRTIELIEADLQIIICVLINKRTRNNTENNKCISKENYGSYRGYLIDNLILEK